MKTVLFAVATCLGLIVPMGLVALTTSDARAARALAYDIKFNQSIVQAQPDRLTPGDRIVLGHTLWHDGKLAGRIEGVCTITSGEGTAICNATAMLDDGTIAVQFVNATASTEEFAVLGGTGAYAGLLGSGTFIAQDDQSGTVMVTLG
jgi:hypothetical protein